MKKNLITAFLMTATTTVLLGVLYPLAVTALAQLFFPDDANGQLISRDGEIIGSRLIAQPFTGPMYFHSRPSAAGTDGYDAASSGGTNYGPTNAEFVHRVHQEVAAAQAENPNTPVPIDMVTTSASGLDPDITPANAEFQLPRVARARHISESELRAIVQNHTKGRQFGFFGEPRVNALELNLALDRLYPISR